MLEIERNVPDFMRVTMLKATYNKERKFVGLTWRWPTGTDRVLIFKIDGDKSIDSELLLKMYNNEKYVLCEKVGVIIPEYIYADTDISIYNHIKCYVLPLIDERVYFQDDEDNVKKVITERHRIILRLYQKKEKRSFKFLPLYTDRRFVTLEVNTPVDIPAETICYKKIVNGLNEPLVYFFVEDFRAGNKVLPEIEIKADENIFFDFINPQYREKYDLRME